MCTKNQINKYVKEIFVNTIYTEVKLCICSSKL